MRSLSFCRQVDVGSRLRKFGAPILLTGVLAAITFSGRAAADRLPPDTVDDLRILLKQDRTNTPEGVLLQKAETLTSLSDLSRALLLEWRIEPREGPGSGADSRIFEMIAGKFQKKAKDVLARGSLLEKVATANLIAETASAGRSLGGSVGQRTVELRRVIAAVGPDLVRLTRDPSTRVRAAAADALGKIEPASPEGQPAGGAGAGPAPKGESADLRQVVDALALMLKDEGAASGPRRAAARALNTLVNVAVRQEKSSRGGSGFNLLFRRELIATCAAVIGPATSALAVSQPLSVRRDGADACRQVTAALIDVVTDPYEAGLSVGRNPLPSERRGPETEGGEFHPVLEAFLANVKKLADGSFDADPGIRVQVRHTIEELAAVFQRLVRQEDGRRRLNALPGETAPAQPAHHSLQAALEHTLSALISGLNDPTKEGRLAAVDALETLDGLAGSSVPALARRARDRNLFVRWAAARALGRLAPEKPELVVPAVQTLLQSDDLDLRLVAATTLMRYGPLAAPAVADLARSVRSGDSDIRIAAMKALENIGTAAEPALPAIAEDLTYVNPQVRTAAARALARFGRAAAFARPALLRALADRDADVRRAASEALVRMDGK